jgi:hypothetical protein
LRQRSALLGLFAVAATLLLAACAARPQPAPMPPVERLPEVQLPAHSIPIRKVTVEDHNTYVAPDSDRHKFGGDLWPAAWADDGYLYAANGDGFGFGENPADIVMNRIAGLPPDLRGEALRGARGDGLGAIWPFREGHVNRKPTGLTCVDGVLYLFCQNLAGPKSSHPFCGAPNASISWSVDHGRTWQWDSSGPMFHDFKFTTGFFLDYGRNNRYAKDDYVYVYGLDYNWRGCPDYRSTKLYLARVRKREIAERDKWEFFVERDASGRPRWARDIAAKAPVIDDESRDGTGAVGVAQGSVVYIPALDRYLFVTWSMPAWVFWEAPEPWGPWTRCGGHAWNKQKWSEDYHGGYATVIPSKFLRPDGLGGWISSSLNEQFNRRFYHYCLRRFFIETE